MNQKVNRDIVCVISLSLTLALSSYGQQSTKSFQDLSRSGARSEVLAKARPQVSEFNDKKLNGGDTHVPGFKIGGKIVYAEHLYLDDKNGVKVGVPVPGNPSSKTIRNLDYKSGKGLMADQAPLKDNPIHEPLKNELAMFLLQRNPNDSEAQEVIKNLIGLDLKAPTDEGLAAPLIIALNEDGKGKHSTTDKTSSRQTAPSPAPSSRAEQILDYLAAPDSWDGSCGLDGICVFKKGQQTLRLDPKNKKAIEALTAHFEAKPGSQPQPSSAPAVAATSSASSKKTSFSTK